MTGRCSINEDRNTVVQVILSSSSAYIEALSVKAIPAQPWLIEFLITSQLLTAKNPDEWRIKSRICLERKRLIEVYESLGWFLQSRGSPGGTLVE